MGKIKDMLGKKEEEQSIFWPCKKRAGVRDGFVNGVHVAEVSKIGGTEGSTWNPFCILCEADMDETETKREAKDVCEAHFAVCTQRGKVNA